MRKSFDFKALVRELMSFRDYVWQDLNLIGQLIPNPIKTQVNKFIQIRHF